jgi:translation initiation factor 2B subunit (eIF-2B alpha/beta/delta family)
MNLLRQLMNHIIFCLQDFQKCQNIMVERGNMFLQKVASSRQKIARQADKFIRDGSVSFIFNHTLSTSCKLLCLGIMIGNHLFACLTRG